MVTVPSIARDSTDAPISHHPNSDEHSAASNLFPLLSDT
jgi:hypothetical protein